MSILVRISSKRCPTHFKEQTKAIYEVPNLLHRIVHWFYERHSMPESFEDVASELIQALVDAIVFLPKHMESALRKKLHFGQPCANCKDTNSNQPLVSLRKLPRFFGPLT